MILNILKEGVKGAFIRIIRLIVYIAILLLGFYIIGLISSSKASALTYNGNLWEPDMSNKSQTYVFGPNNASNWFYFGFTSSWYNNTDYDLLAFRMNKNVAQVQDWSGYNNHIEQFYTLQAILWDDNNYGIPCFRSNDWLDTFFCPITKGTSYHGFTIMANVFDPVASENLELQILLEQNRYFVNYDSTDIITYFDGSGGISGMVIQQQTTNSLIEDTNDLISDTNDYITDSSTSQVQNSTQSVLTDINDDFIHQYDSGGAYSTLTEAVFAPINVALESVDATCYPLQWNIPFVNYQAYIPCMSSSVYGVYFQGFFGTFTSILLGFYAYRAILRLFRGVKEATDAEDDKIEVVDL